MTIMSQTITVSNITKEAFNSFVFDSGFTTMKDASERQRFRRSLGSEFVNGWCIQRHKEWTEYQRYYEVQP